MPRPPETKLIVLAYNPADNRDDDGKPVDVFIYLLNELNNRDITVRLREVGSIRQRQDGSRHAAALYDCRLRPYLDLADRQPAEARDLIYRLVGAVDRLAYYRSTQQDAIDGTAPRYNDSRPPEGDDWNDLSTAICAEIAGLLWAAPVPAKTPAV